MLEEKQEKPSNIDQRMGISSRFDVKEGLITLMLRDVMGKIEESQYGDCHTYISTMKRQTAIDIMGNLLATTFALDYFTRTDVENKSQIGMGVLEDVLARTNQILDEWTEKSKKEEEDVAIQNET